MKYILKLLLLTGLVFLENFAASVEEEPIKGAVVIVGSNRAAGSLIHHVIGIVGQKEGDFSHTKSFPGKRAVSIDPRPCALKELEHIEEDFTTTAKFASDAQQTVLFEWFPGSDRENLFDNEMLKALKKAYDILVPGGTLIIDSHPFFALVGDKEANLVQLLNPFSLFLTEEEIGQIAECLGLAKGGKEIPQAYKKIYPHIKESIVVVSNIFVGIKKRKIANNIFNCMKTKDGGTALISTVVNPMGYMFLWAYHSISRATIMGAALKGIGFEAETSEIGFALKNLLNQRKYAWFIQIKKPIAAKIAEGKKDRQDKKEEDFSR